jgi:DNA-binding MarR family transcriptional regulator
MKIQLESQNKSAFTADILSALRKIMRAVDLHSRHLAHTVGLSGPQLILLYEIAKKEDISVKELAREVNLSAGTVTDILNRLEKRNLIVRRRHQTDGRKVMVTITPQGRDGIEQAPPLLQERFTRALADLKKWEQAQILATLERVATMMAAQDLDAAPILENNALAPGELRDDFSDDQGPVHQPDNSGKV